MRRSGFKGRSRMLDRSERWFCSERSLEALKRCVFLDIRVEVFIEFGWVCDESRE